MNSSTTKKALVVRFDREVLPGFVNLATYLRPDGIELLSPGGAVALVPYRQVKAVCLVKDWEGRTAFAERREFLGRPKTAGLWIEVHFRDGEILQGTLPNDLLQVEPAGVTFVPPEANGNTQRLFAPREAISSLLVLGVVGRPARRHVAKPAAAPGQIQLFDDDTR